MSEKEFKVFYPRSIEEWRKWLEENHQSEQAVWVVFYRKSSNKKSISWTDAVDVALCFGWIDSKKIKIDDITFHQYFTWRKPKSIWSKINKEKVDRLIEEDLMTEAGYRSIEIAKQNGSWTFLDQVEALIIPDELEKAFAEYSGSKDFFLSLSKTIKKGMLYWVISARREETRNRRIEEIVTCAVRGEKPKMFR